MTYQIALGTGGIAGWNILKRTAALQKDLVAKDGMVSRANSYFAENVGKAGTAGDLVDDYRLLRVALGAFGLEGDIANKAFIRKILESDLSDQRSLVNRLSDKRYLKFAQAFGYQSGDQTVTSEGFAAGISAKYLQREFERRVGESDEDMRLGLNAKRELAEMSQRTTSDGALWFEILGNPPLKRVFETAFGFNSSTFGKMPVDRQRQEFIDKAEQLLGSASLKIFQDEEMTEKLVQTFLVRSQAASFNPAQSSYNTALTLLTGMSR